VATLIADARRVFELQTENRWAVARSTAEERAAKLGRLREAIVRHRTALHDAMWDDFHKHRAEVDLTEIQPTLIELEDARSNVARWMRPVSVRTPLLLAGTRSELRYEPRGVVLIMAPWNYPFYLLLAPLVAAVAAGNCAVLRPSEKVPATAAVLTHIISEAFDEAEVACVNEPGIELANALIAMPFDHVFFTGSVAVGRKVMTAAASSMASVTLELGGKSPLVVDETANIPKTAERAVWGKFINAGQTCVAPDYALVHEAVLPAFVAAVKRKIAEFYGESEEARRASPDFPRAIDLAAFRRLSSLLEQSVMAGARVEIGGTTDAAERYIAPTVLTGVGWDSPIMKEEIFGPILPVLGFRSLDEVPGRINALGKPLALYVFSRRRENVETVLRRTSSGGAVVNNVVIHLANPNLPFGGVGESGQGSYHGWYGFRTFSHERSVMRQGPAALVNALYPPYGPKMQRILDLVGRFLT
jgi:aldehyde dehydrogenase (NAD+)